MKTCGSGRYLRVLSKHTLPHTSRFAVRAFKSRRKKLRYKSKRDIPVVVITLGFKVALPMAVCSQNKQAFRIPCPSLRTFDLYPIFVPMLCSNAFLLMCPKSKWSSLSSLLGLPRKETLTLTDIDDCRSAVAPPYILHLCIWPQLYRIICWNFWSILPKPVRSYLIFARYFAAQRPVHLCVWLIGTVVSNVYDRFIRWRRCFRCNCWWWWCMLLRTQPSCDLCGSA